LRERNHLEALTVDRGMISNWISESGMGEWTGLIWLRSGQVAGSGECRNEPLYSIKCGEILD